MTIWAGAVLGLAVLVWRWRRGVTSKRDLVVFAVFAVSFALVQVLMVVFNKELCWDRRYHEPNLVPLLAFAGIALSGLACHYRFGRWLLIAVFAFLFARFAYRARAMYAPDRLNAHILESSRWAASVISEDWHQSRYERIYCSKEYLSFSHPVIVSTSPLTARLVKGRWLGFCLPRPGATDGAYDIRPFCRWVENPDYICIGDSTVNVGPQYVRIAERSFPFGTQSVYRRREGVLRFPDPKRAGPGWKWHYDVERDGE